MKILDPHKYFLVILHILQFLNQIKDVYVLSLARYLSWILKIMKRNIKKMKKKLNFVGKVQLAWAWYSYWKFWCSKNRHSSRFTARQVCPIQTIIESVFLLFVNLMKTDNLCHQKSNIAGYIHKINLLNWSYHLIHWW